MISFGYTDCKDHIYYFRCYKIQDGWQITVDCGTVNGSHGFIRTWDDFLLASSDLISDDAKHYCQKYLTNLAFI